MPILRDQRPTLDRSQTPPLPVFQGSPSQHHEALARRSGDSARLGRKRPTCHRDPRQRQRPSRHSRRAHPRHQKTPGPRTHPARPPAHRLQPGQRHPHPTLRQTFTSHHTARSMIATAETKQTAKTTKVWIVDDHEVFAKQIGRLIESETDMECTQYFNSAANLFEKLQFIRDFPDVLLLDLGLPRRSGLDILPDIRKIMPNSKILVLTAHDDRDKVYRAICNGAYGYLLKTADPDDIIQGIRDVINGTSALSGPISKMILDGFSRYGPVEAIEPLTSREEDVLHHLVRGLIKKEIAEELSISQHTVDMHLRAVYRKLHVRSQTEAVSKALRQGIV
ncbi:MAG: hypothetical protein B9S30_04060 [Verrucomicrobiia bacterium Tous-C5FEB]|nr:MAG: hypothetical protein B9S30_04060 [Verrucomicrobiae bacterium Tous-C5FEB]